MIQEEAAPSVAPRLTDAVHICCYLVSRDMSVCLFIENLKMQKTKEEERRVILGPLPEVSFPTLLLSLSSSDPSAYSTSWDKI